MTDHETTVLTARLHGLADDLTPPLDIAGQVRGARARNRRQRRGRMMLAGVAIGTATVVLGTTTAVALLSETPGRGEVAVPGGSAPATAEVTPEVSPQGTPDVTPEVTPGATPQTTPDAMPEATTDAEVAPDVTPEVTPTGPAG